MSEGAARSARQALASEAEGPPALALWRALAGETVQRRERAYRRVCALLRHAERRAGASSALLAGLAGRTGSRVERERLALEAAVEAERGTVRLLALLRRHLAPEVL